MGQSGSDGSLSCGFQNFIVPPFQSCISKDFGQWCLWVPLGCGMRAQLLPSI